MNQPNLWKKSFENIIDQRSLALPPTWASQSLDAPRPPELGRHVHISGGDRAVAQRLVALLRGAKSLAVVSSFLLADEHVENAMLEAAQRGVRVYVLIASEARLGGDEPDDDFGQLVLDQHKTMLERLAGHVLFRSAPHFHAKMVLIDPHEQPAGLLLTANLTHAALERNEELAVELTVSEVSEAAAFARWAMWETAEHEMVDPDDRFRSVKPLGRLSHPKPGTSIIATTNQSTGLREQVLSLIESASSHLMVASFGWENDHLVVQRLCARATDGLNVTVLARVRPTSMAALIALREAGAKVFGYRWLHAKAIWADSGNALVMSANFQPDGLDRGFELGVLLQDDRVDEVRQRLKTWVERALWRLESTPRLGDLHGEAKIWHGGQFKDVIITDTIDESLGKLTAKSADELTVPTPIVPSNGTLPRMAHELRRQWTVTAPVLAPKAKEVKRPKDGETPASSYSPAVFKEPRGRRVVVVHTSGELEAARIIMDEVGAAAIVLASERIL